MLTKTEYLFIAEDNFKDPLSTKLINIYNKIVLTATQISDQIINDKIITKFEKNPLSPLQVLSYLLGWAHMLLSWYAKGKKNENFIMPGEGFIKWEYEKITEYFYKKYSSNSLEEQLILLKQITLTIISIIETENQSGNLDKLGVWDWCTLKSGKKWPLRKWITVNSLAPYKRAASNLKALI